MVQQNSNNDEIRYLAPPTVDIKRKKYCRFKTPNSSKNFSTSRVKFSQGGSLERL